MEREGIIKFEARHVEGPLPASLKAAAADVLAWREIFTRLGLVGQAAYRYEGAGFGNISARVGPFPGGLGARAFLITGTQTGGRHCMDLGGLSLVRRYELARGVVHSEGEITPSSESMTHGALYDLGPHIRFVVHAHCPEIWRAARTLRLPITAPQIAYGTPQMALEIQRMARTRLNQGVLVMGGHQDGVLAFGRSAEETSSALLTTLAAVYATSYQQSGHLCRMG